jgi:DNA-binding XRE family transcriptional regulator
VLLNVGSCDDQEILGTSGRGLWIFTDSIRSVCFAGTLVHLDQNLLSVKVVKRKVENDTLQPPMNHHAAENYLKAHRRKSGLSLREVANLVGYRHHGPVGRHEQSLSLPSLMIALAYEVIFCVPVSTIFAGVHENIREDIETRLQQLEAELGKHSAFDAGANVTAQKLVWLDERKNKTIRSIRTNEPEQSQTPTGPRHPGQ